MNNFSPESDLFKQVKEISRKHAEMVLRKSKKLDCPFVVECFECGKSFMIADELQRVLKHGHHSKPEQIDLHDAHARAIILVPLHDVAAGHGGGLERNHRI